MSVTAPSVPAVLLKLTVPPLLVKLLPLASFSCTVTVAVLVPLATILLGVALSVLVLASNAPAVKVTVAVAGIAVTPNSPLIVALPAVVADVKVAL